MRLHRLRLHRLRLLDDTTCVGLEGPDLPGGQATLSRQRGEVGDPLRAGGRQRVGRLPGARLQGPNVADARCEEACQPCELRPAVFRVGDGARSLVRTLLQVVQPRHRILERCRAEQDCDRARLAFLVERPQVLAKHAL